MLRNNTCRLLVQHMNDALRTTVNDGVEQNSRDRDQQTQYGSHQRRRDTAGHRLGITSTKNGDCLEGNDHTGHRTEQTHQRRDRRDDLQQGQGVLDGRSLT